MVSTQSKSVPDLDKLITGLEPVERDLHTLVLRDLEQLEKEGLVLPEDDRLDDRLQQEMDQVRQLFTAAYGDKERSGCTDQTILLGQEFANDLSNAWRAVEPDRLISSNVERENEGDRARGDDRGDRSR
jgi:hypothetical protein